MSDERYRELAERINNSVEREFSWLKAGRIDTAQVKYALAEAREFIMQQGANPERSSHFQDNKVRMHPPELKGMVCVELHISGRFPVSMRGGAQAKMVPGTERRLQSAMNPMDRKWLTVEIGENLQRYNELRGTPCQTQSTWSRIDLEIHRRENFEAARTQAIEERKAQVSRPQPPAFLQRTKQPEREREVMK